MKIKKIPFTAFEEEGHSIKTIHIADMIPNVMDKVTIFERNGEHILDIPPEMDGMKFKAWLKTAAGIFSKDFLAWLREKPIPEYMMVKSSIYKTAIRLIRDDELLTFETLNLVNGKIKDKYYTHIKTVEATRSLHGIERKTVASSLNIEETESENDNENDNENTKYHSKSLFK